MDGNRSTGNPSTSLPRTLPVDTLQLCDWILAPEEADGQSQEPLTMFTSQNHQSVQGTLQSLGKNLQIASESRHEPGENVQGPLESLQKENENVQNPSENVQKPSESPQGLPENVRKHSISLQEPAENLQKPTGSLREPAENLYPPSDKCKETDKNCQESVENVHRPLDIDQKLPETLQLPSENPEEDQHIFLLDLHHPPSGDPESGSSSPPSGPSFQCQEPSTSENENVEVFSPPFSPGFQQPPENPTELQQMGVSPEFNLTGKYSELNPPESSLQFHPPGDLQKIQPSAGCPEFYPPGDTTGHQKPRDPPPAGNDAQNLSKSSPSSPQQALAHASSGEPQLCGFLLKLGGPLKTWKQRWFCYEKQRNQLVYYRRPHDLTPLGQVGLNGTTFSPVLEVNSSSSSFLIHTPKRTFTLKADDPDLMFYWLQQLQLKRWQHRQSTSSGLDFQAEHDDFLPMRRPVGLVGQQAANTATQRTPLANLSLKHPLIEFQNLVHCLLRTPSFSSSSSSFSRDLSRSVFHVEAPAPWTPPTSAHSTATGSQRDEPEVHHPFIYPPAKGRSGSSTPPLSVSRRRKKSSQKLHRGSAPLSSSSDSCSSTSSTASSSTCLQQDESLTDELKAQKQVQDLQEEVQKLREKNRIRQEVIVKLSDQLSLCMANQEAVSCSAFKQLQQEVENLRDDLQAHQNQNRFLNSEIFHLTRLWRSSSEQEKNLMVKCADLESRSHRVERNYLDVLQPLLEAQNLKKDQREALQHLVEQSQQRALQSSARVQESRDQYDQYGFKLVPDYEVGDLRLLALVQAQEIQQNQAQEIQQIQAQEIQAQHIQALEIRSQQEALQHSLTERWAQYLAGKPDQDLVAGPELKALLRNGIPPQYRARVWKWIVRARTRTVGEQHQQSYQQLCQKIQTAPLPASRQIDLDLHRTMITNQHFSSPSSPAHQQLRRILLAFSWRNPAIGYCQGLNRLAAIALLVLQEEQEAFWCLVAVVEAILPQDYYTSNLVASQADQRVLKDLMEEKLPRLAAHLAQHGVDVTLVTFHWFLVVFVENLPGHVLLPLWDAFLYEGSKVVFRYTLALLKYKEAELLRLHDTSDIYHYLRFFPRTVTDSRRLASLAFKDMNPFPGRLLRNRRALHLQHLQGELQELEQQQQRDQVMERAERQDKELGAAGGASEDDDL